MSKDQDNPLAGRFAALAPEPLPGDWDDVLARAGVADFPGPQQTKATWLPRWRWAAGHLGVRARRSRRGRYGFSPGHIRLPVARRPQDYRGASARVSRQELRQGRQRNDAGQNSNAYALAIQRDGKLVAAGYEDDSDRFPFALVRYNANGTLDGSFGRGGKVRTLLGSNAVAYALAIQQDGKLVAAGVAYSSGNRSNFALVRYNANGTLDRSFGRGGKVMTSMGGVGWGASALAIQQDGKLVAAGSSGHRFALVRYNANGTLDRSFGRGGKVMTSVGAGGRASALAIQQDGKLVAAGHSTGGNGFKAGLALVRYNPNGTLDGSFGQGGKVTTPSWHSNASALAIQPDGKLVAAGTRGFALVRFNPNGTLDRSFGRGGTVMSIGSGANDADALAIQQDGKLVAAGGGSRGTFALVRFNPNGTLDRSFGRGGRVAGHNVPIKALAIQHDGKLVTAGSFDNGFVLVRRWP
jgi:uncharacterized delta-60 repeat protein